MLPLYEKEMILRLFLILKIDNGIVSRQWSHRRHSLFSLYIYMRMLYMLHILYDIYVTLSSPSFLCSLLLPFSFLTKFFLLAIPVLSWTEGATMRPMLGMLFF